MGHFPKIWSGLVVACRFSIGRRISFLDQTACCPAVSTHAQVHQLQFSYRFLCTGVALAVAAFVGAEASIARQYCGASKRLANNRIPVAIVGYVVRSRPAFFCCSCGNSSSPQSRNRFLGYGSWSLKGVHNSCGRRRVRLRFRAEDACVDSRVNQSVTRQQNARARHAPAP